ncbi:MAG: hypothetical protein P1V51_23205 [Deltaproteobacteria bacterium]|nr:hypothetical protein [Deltaproteobacteria bacterium]
MRRTLPTLATLLVLSLTAACGTGGNDDPDGGVTDGGGAAIGEACPGGDPLACAERICLSGTEGQTYCSAYCGVSDQGSCPADFPCQRYLFGDPAGQPADLRDVCAPPCQSDGQCQSGVCELPAGLCTSPARGLQAAREPCGGSAGVCLENHVCQQVQGQLVCLPTCDPTVSPFCGDGAFCWAANVPRGGRCWPGGTSEDGDPCTDHLDCAKGMLCILQNGESTCRIGCVPGGTPSCAGGAACLPLEGRSYGFCQG